MATQLLEPKRETCPSQTDQHQSSRLIDAVMVMVAVVAVVMRMRLLDDAWFYVDDWPLAVQTTATSGLIRGYNGHLSTVIIAIYWVLLKVFGFSTYFPYKLVGMVGLASPGIVLYFTSRRRIGTALAALAGVVLLFPAHIVLTVPAFNHYLALTFGILCAAALNSVESKRSNIKVGGFLALSLASAGGGVAVAAGAILFCCSTRPSWRRWIAIALPTGLWTIWWFGMPGYRGPDGSVRHPSTSQIISSVLSGVHHILDTLGPIGLIGALFAAIFVIRAAFAIKGGLRKSANLVAWSGSLMVWLIALAWTRGGFTKYVFRYDFVGLGFALLAMIPTQPIRNSRLRPSNATWTTASVAMAILAVVGILGASSNSSTTVSARSINAISGHNLAVARYVNLGPKDTRASLDEGLWFYGTTAGQMRTLFATYGGMPLTPQARDRAALGYISTQPDPWHRRTLPHCETSWTGGTLLPGQYLVAVPPGPAVNVLGRFLGPTWQALGTIPGGRASLVSVPGLLGKLNLQILLRPNRPGSRAAKVNGLKVTCLP